MGNVANLRQSRRLLERAICWAAAASWADVNDFAQAQRDATDLLALSEALSELCKAAGSYRIFEQMGYRWLVESLRRVEELTKERELERS